MFKKAYDTILSYVDSPYAIYILALLSFTESFVSPIPPDVMLIPMMIHHRKNIPHYITVCTAVSVVGGILGYYIGFALYDVVGQYIVSQEALTAYQQTFSKWGFLLLCVKGFIPIPYKVVAIAAGLAKFNLPLFVVASIIARTSRFILLGVMVHYYGAEVKRYMERNVNQVMIITIIAIIAMVYVGFKVI